MTKTKENKNYQSGDKIFAKVKGFVYWPARVNPLPPDIKIPNNKIPIFFYGTHEVYFIAPSSCWVYDDKTKAKWGKPRPRAHFNQGMDEIENNPTILQYLADPAGEEFLTQFYEFTKSNGEFNSLNTIETEVNDEKLDDTSRSRKSSGNQTNKSDSKSIKSQPKLSHKRKVSEVEADEGSDSPSVDSDNLADEDFKPASKKSKKTPVKQIKIAPKKSSTPSAQSRTKRIKSTKKSIVTKDVDENQADLESLSSISSTFEDWKEKDARDKKEIERKLHEKQKEDFMKEEKTVKEVVKITRERRRSEIKGELKDIEVKMDYKMETIEEMTSKCDKEIVVKLTKTELLTRDNIGDDIVEDVKLVNEKEDIFKEQFDCVKDTGDDNVEERKEIIKEKKQQNEEKKEQIEDKRDKILEQEYVEEKSECISKPMKNTKKIVSPTNSLVDLDSVIEKPKHTKKSRKLVKKSVKSREIRPVQNKKRSRKISSDYSDEDCEDNENKTPKSHKVSKLDDENEEVETTSATLAVSQLEVLQNYNNDIRSSLVLGNEDYEKCLCTFRMICEMKIELLNLVKVWQLMETVKKCRKYKRNDSIKIEAQNVYKKFMDIYSNATDEELATSQVLLVEYRNQNKTNKEAVKTNGKHEQEQESEQEHEITTKTNNNQSTDIPVSVDAMFHVVSVNNDSNNCKDQVPIDMDHSVSSDAMHHDTVEQSVSTESETPVSVPPPQVDPMLQLSAELDAKAMDILNKIEKNVPLNQKSLSHLLPPTSTSSDSKPLLNLPSEWQSVKQNDSNNNHNIRTKVSDDEDEEEEDEEAIYRRIEEVPLKLCDNDEENEMEVDVSRDKCKSTSSMVIEDVNQSQSSTLDARIANLINSSMPSKNNGNATSSSSRNAKSKSTDKKYKSYHGRSSRSTSNNHSNANKRNTVIDPPISPPRRSDISLEPSFPPIKTIIDSNLSHKSVTKTTIKESVVPPVATSVPSSSISNTQSNDNDIYDMLGV